MSRLTKAGMLFAHLTHMNNNLAAVSQIVSGLFKKFLISNGYYFLIGECLKNVKANVTYKEI